MLRAFRQSIRSLIRTPRFPAAAVLILALAIGTNAAIFGLLHALVLRPLPVPAPHELVQLWTRDSAGRLGGLTWGQFRGLNERQRVFSAVIGSLSQGVLTVEMGTTLLRASTDGVTGNYFGELGARAAAGRLIEESDVDLAAASGEAVAVVSWSFWHGQLGADPAAVGRQLRVEGVPVTIVGVAPRGFLGLGITIEHDLTVPLTLVPRLLSNETAMIRGTQRWVMTTGRLAPARTLEGARAQVEAIWPSIRESALPPGLAPDRRERYVDSQIHVESGATGVELGLRRRYTTPLSALLAIAAIVLTIATVNLCALFCARLDSRRHELGVRLAIGATRSRLVLALALEGLIVGAAGAVGGLLFASYASTAIVRVILRDYAVRTALDVAPDATVITLAVAVGTLLGAALAAGAAWIVVLRGTVGVQSGGTRNVARASRVGKVLVGIQAALSVVLLTHVVTLGRNLYAISTAPTGMTAEHVLVGSPLARPGGYGNLNPDVYYRQTFDRLAAIPGVEAAAFVEHRPEGGALPLREPVSLAGAPPDAGGAAAETAHVSPGFFDTMGITVLHGRDFSFDDTDESPRVAILSRGLAQRLFGDLDRLGARIRLGTRPEWQDLEVVGVVSDARVFDLRGGNVSVAYVPFLQSGDLAHYKFLVVRAPPGAAQAVRESVESLGAETMPRISTLEYARGRAILQERVMAGVGAWFALLALILVAAGLYGLLTYVLSLRKKEFGIRLALGADARRLGRAIAAQGLSPVAIGGAVGLVGVVTTAGLPERVIASASARDPMAIAIAWAVLLTVALAACAVPARRAARVDPAAELGCDRSNR